MISADIPDWDREVRNDWAPSTSLIAAIRTYQHLRHRKGPLAWIRRKIIVLRHRYWSAITGADVPLNVQIGGGLLMPHPNGIVIHPAARIGNNCLIFQQVTVGSNGRGVPIIGGHVDIGAGAKIFGPVFIGDHAVIGANAVVTIDVPAGRTAAGVPAKILPESDLPKEGLT